MGICRVEYKPSHSETAFQPPPSTLQPYLSCHVSSNAIPPHPLNPTPYRITAGALRLACCTSTPRFVPPSTSTPMAPLCCAAMGVECSVGKKYRHPLTHPPTHLPFSRTSNPPNKTQKHTKRSFFLVRAQGWDGRWPFSFHLALPCISK